MAIITTTHGDMDESLLTKMEGTIDTAVEFTTWVEYYIGTELVHRSAHVTLKQMPTFADGVSGSIG